MIQPKIGKVYKDIKEQFVLDFDPTAIEEHEGYFFTPEEFEQFKRELITKFSQDYSEYCLKYGRSSVTTWLKLNTTNYFK